MKQQHEPVRRLDLSVDISERLVAAMTESVWMVTVDFAVRMGGENGRGIASAGNVFAWRNLHLNPTKSSPAGQAEPIYGR